MRLYINDEFCDSFERLRCYIKRLENRSIREDLLDIARCGDLSKWLDEHSLVKLAEEIEKINSNESIGDADYITRLSALFEVENKYKKVPYEKCLKFVDASISVKNDTLLIRVRFQILDDVNETYRISAASQIEKLQCDINPSRHTIGTCYDVVLTQEGYNAFIEQKYTIALDNTELKTISFGGYHDKKNPLNMIKVIGGSYQMGATSEQGNDASENEIKRRVKVHDFLISAVPVTRSLWNSVMGDSHGEGNNKPITNVSNNDCKRFMENLNQITGEKYRHPTEEEWEYAARGGQKSRHFRYSGSNNISDIAWCRSDNNRGTIREVGTKKPNELGIYDMSGNVWEWTSSVCTNFTKDKSQKSLEHMVTRGGCANSTDKGCRVSRRYSSEISHKSRYLGFRLAK